MKKNTNMHNYSLFVSFILMVSNYFLDIDVSQWFLKSAFQAIEADRPLAPAREILRTLKKMLADISEAENNEKATAAKKTLRNWKVN